MRLKQPIHKAITTLKQERSQIEQRLTQLQSTIDRLTALSKGGGKMAQSSSRQLSSAGREAISRAAKKRWAQYRRAKARQTESHA
jgi:hypothetical protein